VRPTAKIRLLMIDAPSSMRRTIDGQTFTTAALSSCPD
jgi:hypothetical protein